MPEYSFDEALSAAPDRPSIMIAIDSRARFHDRGN
jgi:hypothetical protein